MGNTGSLGSGGVATFDLHSQAGIMVLLASIRASGLGPAEKNELRDLVFLYTNGGGDASVRIALEQKLQAYQVQMVNRGTQVVSSHSVPPSYPFGTSRPAPEFTTPLAAPVVTPTPVAPPAPAYVPPAPVATPAPVSSVPVAPPPPVVPAPVAYAAAPVTAPIPAVAPVVPPAPAYVPPAPVATPAPVSSVPVTPPPVATVSVDQTQYLERIREIKSLVNQKVGNPVNLVDIDNVVGREYMNALLDAMKKLSGGLAGEMGAAMQRLEIAYQSVERAIALHVQNKGVQSAPTPAPIPVVTPPPAPVAVPPPPAVTPVSVPPPTPSSPSPRTTILPPPAWESEMHISVPSQNQPVPVAVASSAPTVLPSPIPVPPAAAPKVPPVTLETQKRVTSLADDPRKVLTPQDLPDSSVLNEAQSGGDPLFTKDVDDGLEQLLSEWVLFKKSGLFGTGPRGREHPLFKKLAPLPIPLLLAGRFEGSTQEIKQSITDYMNGWRYEQGIIYDQGETFERYLRRVIKHIIELQKKRRGA